MPTSIRYTLVATLYLRPTQSKAYAVNYRDIVMFIIIRNVKWIIVTIGLHAVRAWCSDVDPQYWRRTIRSIQSSMSSWSIKCECIHQPTTISSFEYLKTHSFAWKRHWMLAQRVNPLLIHSKRKTFKMENNDCHSVRIQSFIFMSSI